MKNGICPKCNSKEVYQKEGHPSQREHITLSGGVISQGVPPKRYACTACGYTEFYIEGAEHLKVIRENWKKV